MATKQADVSIERIQVVYDGDPVERGTMDVRDLAPSLLSLSGLCQEVNRQIHGNETTVSVRVKADFKRGSFGVKIEIVQTLLERLSSLLKDDKTQTVIETIFGAGGVIALLKWLKGEKEPSATSLENGNIKIEVTGINNHIVVKPHVARMAKDPNILKHIDGTVRPLKKSGMREIAVKKQNKTLQTVQHDEAQYLMTDQEGEITGPEGDTIHEVTRTAYLEILKLSFRENNKWNFGDGAGGSLQASIEDDDFLDKVNHHTYVFGKRDQLKVLLKTTTAKSPAGKYTTEHRIVKVVEFIPSPQTDMFK